MTSSHVQGCWRLPFGVLGLFLAFGCSDNSSGDSGEGGTSGTTSGAGGMASGAGGTAGSGTSGSAGLGGSAGTASGGSSGTMPGTQGRWEEADTPFNGATPDSVPVKLLDGSVLMIGGYGSDQVYRFDPDTQMVVTMDPLPEQRGNLAAALLTDGRVLVAGGDSPEMEDGMASCLLYDPSGDSWTSTGSLPAPRALMAAITLPNGDVLALGGVSAGIGGTPASEVYRYSTSAGTWQALAPLSQPARFHSLFLLDANSVLVAAENPQVYSLSSPGSTSSPALTERRRYAATVQLPTHGVLALGGAPLTVLSEDDVPFATVDEVTLGASSFAARAPLAIARSAPGAATLQDGTVFVAGGSGVFVGDDDPAAQTAERYVPGADRWYPEAPPPAAVGGPAVLLNDGSVFFLNGLRFHPTRWQ